MNVVIVSPTPSLQSLHGTTLPSSSLEQFKPSDIAESLTAIEGEFYSKITQADYIAHVRGTPITTHIASACKINNRLVNWVKWHVIRSGKVCFGEQVSLNGLLLIRFCSYKDVNRRSTKFKYFVLIAEVLPPHISRSRYTARRSDVVFYSLRNAESPRISRQCRRSLPRCGRSRN